MIFRKILIFVFLLFLLVILVPELFRKVRETHTKHSHQVACKTVGLCTSYVQKNKNMNFTHSVFPHVSRLTVRIEHFRLENRIPDAQLYHFPAGMVLNHEVESKHLKHVFLICFFLFPRIFV